MPYTRDPPTYPPGTKQGRFPTPGAWRLDQFLVDPACEPLEFLLGVMRDETQPFSRRLDAAKAAAPYRHIKMDEPFFRSLTKAQLDQIKNARVIEHKRT
jgi:hypothetical protein